MHLQGHSLFFVSTNHTNLKFNSFTKLQQTKSLVRNSKSARLSLLKTSISQLSEVEDFFPAPMRPLQLSSTWPAATNASDPPTQRCGWSSRRAVLLRAKSTPLAAGLASWQKCSIMWRHSTAGPWKNHVENAKLSVQTFLGFHPSNWPHQKRQFFFWQRWIIIL